MNKISVCQFNDAWVTHDTVNMCHLFQKLLQDYKILNGDGMLM